MTMILSLIFKILVFILYFLLNLDKSIIPSWFTFFYTNLTYEDNDDNVHIYSLVKGVHIKLSSKSLGCILSIPYHGLSLNDIDIADDEVLSNIFLSGQGLPMTNNKLKPIPRLIGRILAYNICPKLRVITIIPVI